MQPSKYTKIKAFVIALKRTFGKYPTVVKVTKRTLKALLFVAITVALTWALDMIFELNESDTEGMLINFANEDHVDTVFVGNSAGKMMDGDYYGELTKIDAVNMCTPSQSLDVSLRNIKLAYGRHKIKKAVLLTTCDSFDETNLDMSEHVYDRVINSSTTNLQSVRNSIKANVRREQVPGTISKEESINLWFPWVVETSPTFKDIKETFLYRLVRLKGGTSLGAFFPYDFTEVVYPYDEGELTLDDKRILGAYATAIENSDIPQDMIDMGKLEKLAKIISFCRDNDIEFEVVITPHRTDYFDRTDSFRENIAKVDAMLGKFVSAWGNEYHNAENDLKVHEILPDVDFYDWEHVSEEYRTRSTEYLAELIERK